MRTLKSLFLSVFLSAALLLLPCLVSCRASDGSADSAAVSFDAQRDRIVIEMEDGGIIRLELYPDQAPATVANFVKLVDEGFYDGLKFHRVIDHFMIQGGDPKGDGTGGAGATIRGEFRTNGFDNTISHTRGVVSMARARGYNSASSQFFIVQEDATYLDGDYAAFGRVTEGMDVVDRIASTPCDADDMPLTDQVIREVRIEHAG